MSSGGGPNLEQLRIDIIGDDVVIQKNLNDVQLGLRATEAASGPAAAGLSQVGRASQEASVGLSASSQSASALKDQIKGLSATLLELQGYEKAFAGSGGASSEAQAQLKNAIRDTETQIKSLQNELNTLGKVGDSSGKQLSLSYGAVHGIFRTVSDEIMHMTGVAIPGLTEVSTVSGSLAERMAMTQGASLGLTIGLIGVGIAAIAVGGSLVKLGADLQQVDAGIAAAGNVSLEEANKISTAFGAISGTILESTTQTGKAFEHVHGELTAYTGAALTASQATEFMTAAGRGAIASGQDLTQVTKGLAEQLIATHSSIGESDRVMNALYITSRNTGTSIEQTALIAGRLEERMGSVAPSVEQVGIALTLAAQSGVIGQRAMQGVVTTLEALGDPSEKARKNLELMEVEIVKNEKGQLQVAETLSNLRVGYDALGSAEAKHAVAEALVGKEHAAILESLIKTTDALPHITEAYEDHNRVVRDAGIQSNTLEGHVKSLTAEAQSGAAAIGSTLAGALVELGNGFSTTGKQAKGFLDTMFEIVASSPANVAAINAMRQALSGELVLTGPLGDAITGASAPKRKPLTKEEYYAQLGLQPDGKTPIGVEPIETAAETPEPHKIAGFDTNAIQQQTELNVALGSTAERIHNIMVAAQDAKTPEDLKANALAVADAVSREADAILKAYDPARPEQAKGRSQELIRLSDEYSKAINAETIARNDETTASRVAAQVALDSYNIQIEGENRAQDAAKKDETYRNQQAAAARSAAAEAKRQKQEAQEADPLFGMAQGMQRDREDLIGTAGRVMGDLNAMLTLQGQKGASEAGKAFATEARSWGQELQKAGVSGWQDAFDQLMALGQVAVVTHSPEIISAIHNMLAQGEEAIRQSKIDKAMTEAATKANAEILEATRAFENNMLTAQTGAADARLASMQSEQDREYTAWATAQVRLLTESDKFAQEEARRKETQAQEDLDRGEANRRATEDRARNAGRAVTDINLNAQTARVDEQRHQQQAQAEAEIQHQQRLAEIRKKGGPGEAAATTSENESYEAQKAQTLRASQTQAKEAEIKTQEQIAQAQRRAAEQEADASRRAQEQQTDLEKTRERQERARTQQAEDEKGLNGPGGLREQHEQAFHIDAESRAQQRYQNELIRIDAKYAHEAEKAQETFELAEAKARSQEAQAGITARVKAGAIDEDQGAEELRAEQGRLQQQLGEIQRIGRTITGDIDTAARAQQAMITQGGRAPGFNPGQVSSGGAAAPPWLPQSYQQMLQNGIGQGGGTPGAAPAGTPPTPIDYSNLAQLRPIQIIVQVGPGTTPQEVGYAVRDILRGAGSRAEVAGAVPGNG